MTLNRFKKEYRPRFCREAGSKIDIQPGQNILKVVRDYFENCDDNLSICSPSATHCSTPIVQNEKRTSVHSKRPKAGLTNSVKRACDSPESLPASPIKRVRNREQSHEATLKPGTHDYVAVSKKTESPVCKGEANNRLEDVDVLCITPAVSLDSEDDHGSVKSPLLLEEPKPSPAHVLRFDDRNSPAAVNIHLEVENLEGPQTGRDENVVIVQGRKCNTKSPAESKSFSSAVLAAVATGALGKRYSASISPPSPPHAEVQNIEIEDECEFLIDELDNPSSKFWFSVASKNNKLKRDTSVTPVSKSQPSRKNTESRKGKKRKVQAEALTEQQADDLDVRVLDFKGVSESEADCNSEGNVLKSPWQSSTRMGKTGKDALRQGSSKQKKMSRRPEADAVTLPQPELETQASDAEQCKTSETPGRDSPLPSGGHEQEKTVSLKRNLKLSKNLQLASKASQHLDPKKKTAKQKPPKAPLGKGQAESPRKKLKKSAKKSSNKKALLQREKSSDSEPGEEEMEKEPVKPDEEFTSVSHQKLQTPTTQKLTKSENILQVLESLDDASNRSLVKALQYLIDSMRSSEVKQLPAKSPEKAPQKLCHRDSEGACSDTENAQSRMRSDSTPVRGMVRKKQKLAGVKGKSNKRKHHVQHGPHGFCEAEKATNCASGPVLEDDDKLVPGNQYSEHDSLSPAVSEDLDFQARALSDKSRSGKIVMPSNTPNVRRTKRIRLKPLEYWRGERVDYAVSPSGNLVLSGVVCPETGPPRTVRQRKDGHKQKTAKRRKKKPLVLDHSLADTAKPTIVLDPVTNEEVPLECVTTEMCHSCFFKDETVEIYKHLNTSAFATGKLILKPLKEKGHQFVHMDTIVFHVIYGKIITTLHKTSYCLSTGDYFYVPAGNGYNIRNLLDEESVLLFTQLKKDR
ncbi:centromere protein C isoform X1 [Pogoniulus pusillus]|uniref:centromere protein C isoform X1 n=1 Tax=Pogoniulus pusillus TaxID=488313 RepID=UPI0030B987A2